MEPKSSYRHCFIYFADTLIPVYNWDFNVLGGRGHEAFRRHVLELAALKGSECVLDAGLAITHEELGVFALRKQVVYRVAIKQADPA